MSKTAPEKFQEVMEQHIDPILLSHGFKTYRRRKDDRCYERWQGDYRDNVGIIFSKSRGHDAVSVTVGVDVGYCSIAEFWDGCAGLAKFIDVKRPRGVGGELRLLSYGGFHVSRVIDEKVTVDEAGDVLCSEIRDHAFPFFEEFHDLRRAIKAWRNLELATGGITAHAFRAAAHYLLGETDEARAILQKTLASAQRYYRNTRSLGAQQELDTAEQMMVHFEARMAEDSRKSQG